MTGWFFSGPCIWNFLQFSSHLYPKLNFFSCSGHLFHSSPDVKRSTASPNHQKQPITFKRFFIDLAKYLYIQRRTSFIFSWFQNSDIDSKKKNTRKVPTNHSKSFIFIFKYLTSDLKFQPTKINSDHSKNFLYGPSVLMSSKVSAECRSVLALVDNKGKINPATE